MYIVQYTKSATTNNSNVAKSNILYANISTTSQTHSKVLHVNHVTRLVSETNCEIS